MKRILLASMILIVLATSLPVTGQGQGDPPPAAAVQPQADKAPFAAEIAAFEAEDRKQPPPPGGVLFVGSSSIRLWKTLAQDFPELPIINRGFGGSEIADSIRYADRIVLPYHPKLIVLYAGTNDLNAGKAPASVLKDFQTFVALVHRALPDTRIAFISINPSVARWGQESKALETNRLVERYIRRSASPSRKLSYLDSHDRLLSAEGTPRPEILRADGLHLNAQGYKEWTAILRPQVLALWSADAK